MRVFLDTNVLASATATRGLCADVLREVLALHELVVSPPLFNELKRVLARKFGLSEDIVSDVLELLQEDTIFSKPGKLSDIQIKDKDDVIILSSALTGKADIFITGDKELLKLRKVGRLEIVSPRDFWERLKA
ncbi:MAG: putative toxin-antitoxin system toxin component, PIN family [PVC group bacterium]